MVNFGSGINAQSAERLRAAAQLREGMGAGVSAPSARHEAITLDFEGARITIEGLGPITSSGIPAWLRIVANAVEREQEQERGPIRMFNFQNKERMV